LALQLRIIDRGEGWIAVDKPPGFFVHPHEDRAGPRPIQGGPSCLHLLRDQIGQYIYPVHRLDRPTAGVLLFALSSERAGELATQFQSQNVRKRYIAVVRGWTRETGVLDRPLDEKESQTEFKRLGTLEIAVPSERYPTSRFSLVEVFPRTGRMHQIRRHFAAAGFPLIGDARYGDSPPTRVLLEYLKIQGLLLHAYQLEMPGLPKLRSRWGKKWHRVFDAFGICPC